MKSLWIAGVCAAVLWTAVPGAAHHSMAGFDRTKTVSLEGTVVQFKWANPHSWIEIDVPDATGKVVRWNVEMTAPAFLAKAGWKSTSLKPGDKVTVVGNPLINGDPGAIFVSVKLADGQELTQRAQPAGKGKGK
jgi:hypothetical protein